MNISFKSLLLNALENDLLKDGISGNIFDSGVDGKDALKIEG